jgi:glycosyltransferase involved in cell wall biosynthesis
VVKVIVQIPCYNEEATLAATLAAIPRRLQDVTTVEVLVIDDGSSDRTVRVARQAGADHIVCHSRNRGLAATFGTGLDACLRLGADIIVNTDGDNQYCGHEIAALIRPIVEGDADIAIGDRQTANNPHFSPLKKFLEVFGSWGVGIASGLKLPDAVSGFRAYSRDAAIRINVLSSFSYTIETVIQAGCQNIAVVSVPIRTNPPLRPSRLFRTIPQFVGHSLKTLIRAFAMYRPLAIFLPLSASLCMLGILPLLRFLLLYSRGVGTGHVQSLMFGGVALLTGALTLMFGLFAELIACNRRLLETTLEKVRRIELNQGQMVDSQVMQYRVARRDADGLTTNIVLSRKHSVASVPVSVTTQAHFT